MDKPDVDSIEGLSPAISIDQKASSHNPRSTVGTVTEIHDYLRLLFAKIGRPHCLVCGREIEKLTVDEIVEKIFDLYEEKKIKIISPVVRDRKGEYDSLLFEMYKAGFNKAIVDGKKLDLNPKSINKINLVRYKKHNIDIVIDTLLVNEENLTRLYEEVENAIRLSKGIVKIECQTITDRVKNNQCHFFNQNLSCPQHEDAEFPEIEPRLFSFNSPQGACSSCDGLGTKKEIDPDLVVPDKNKTIARQAIMPWSSRRNNYHAAVLRAVTNFYSIDENIRFRDLSDKEKKIILYGEEEADIIPVSMRSKTGMIWRFNIEWKGIVGFLRERYFKTESEAVRAEIEQYMSQKPCDSCKGTRYRSEVLSVTVGGKNIAEISSQSVEWLIKFFSTLKLKQKEKIIAERILAEVRNRLLFLKNVGLGYLTLSRAANTLAGGETQRIRLASQIGSKLTGVLYILDEPSVGLHPRDNNKLLDTLIKLKDLGNTVIVIEHDEKTMRKADLLVDIGPQAGENGGQIVATGSIDSLISQPKSITGRYLSGQLKINIPKNRRPVKNKDWIIIKGASENNLKSINVEIPLKTFTCVTGVSGSGKSTLVVDILYRALAQKLTHSIRHPGRFSEIIGAHKIKKVFLIDQSPIGRTPRSNPATYTGVFTSIRELFASTREAKIRGFNMSRFSFNVPGGRCENCAGEGFIKVEMQFMSDIYLPCDVCRGQRYNSETLKVKYKGKNIAEVLKMTVSEALPFFENFENIRAKLKVLEEVGLGYIRLGQAATTLSGGEAQRIKLAAELSHRSSGDIVYVLDEPTTGLHFDDIKKLLSVLNKLVDGGNTVIVIEHNLDVIKNADWIIDLGPEGGDGGGRVVVTGPPEEVIKYHKESYTAKFLKSVLSKK